MAVITETGQGIRAFDKATEEYQASLLKAQTALTLNNINVIGYGPGNIATQRVILDLQRRAPRAFVPKLYRNSHEAALEVLTDKNSAIMFPLHEPEPIDESEELTQVSPLQAALEGDDYQTIGEIIIPPGLTGVHAKHNVGRIALMISSDVRRAADYMMRTALAYHGQAAPVNQVSVAPQKNHGPHLTFAYL